MSSLQDSIKVRTFPETNYRAIFHGGNTLRLAIDPSKPITELRFPEFYDITGGTFCIGKCPWCYASASDKGVNYTNLAEKLNKFFGKMTQNQRPFQAAWGGSQCILSNPEWEEAFNVCIELGIIPNVTTHGMTLTEDVATKLKKYSGGIAISLYRHTEKYWRKAIDVAVNAEFQTNLHVIVSDKQSIDQLVSYYKEFSGKVDYFVVLPYKNVGHARKMPREVDYDYLAQAIEPFYGEGKLAFGANAHGWLTKNSVKYKIPVFPPELFSKYLVLDDNVTLYNNSFDMINVPYNNEGCELGYVRTEF
jgi:sulfatase maturation enzyme AslB (radical SAM superfamily)